MFEVKANYRHEDGSTEERVLRPWQADYWRALYRVICSGSWKRTG